MAKPDISKEEWRQFRERVVRALDIEAIYSAIRRSGRENNEGWVSGFCPFHEDSSSSFSFCVANSHQKGNWKCFAGCGYGSIFDYWSRINRGLAYIDCCKELGRLANVEMIWDQSEDERKEDQEKQMQEDAFKPHQPNEHEHEHEQVAQPEQSDKSVDQAIIYTWHRRLASLPDRITYLHQKRGITLDTIKKFKLGWSSKHHRYTIPIVDINGVVRNIRMYDPHRSSGKVMNFVETIDGRRISYGSPIRLFNIERIAAQPNQPVIFTEGETDCIVLDQHGFCAVSSTGGCMTFRPEWLSALDGRDVVICYDCDEKGKKAVNEIVVPILSSYKKLNSLRVLTLPLKGTSDDKDITDYFVKHHKTAQDFKLLLAEANPSEFESSPSGGAVGGDVPNDVIMLSSFTEVERNEHIGKKVRCILVASGETSESFHAVRKFKITHCKMLESNRCPCILKNDGVYDIPPDARERIGSCMASDISVMNMLRDFCCTRGQRPTIEILEKETITEFFCHQDAVRLKVSDETILDNEGNELLEKRVYLSSPDRPKLGRYAAVGWVTSNPKTQQITLLIEQLQALEDDYQSFDISKHRQELEYLRSLETDELLDFLATNVVRIYRRPQLILAVLLTFLSPRWLYFNNEQMRGWINSLILGDVGAGKSQTYTRISDFVSVGDIFSGLTGSRTGLVYGMADHRQKGWQVKAGRIPANSRKVLMIDELNMLDQSDIRTMSKGMDEGFVQIDRISSGGYETQTRLQMISNPRDDVTMDRFMHGCEAIKDLLPAAVIRRIDFAVLVNAHDIDDLDILNMRFESSKMSNLKIVGSTLRSLIYWAWNLDMRDIHFDREAVTAILDGAKKLSFAFGDAHDIPLVNPSDMRKKLARISAAVAVLHVSTNFGNPALVILPKHVEFAIRFLDELYRADNCKLDEYAAIHGMNTNITDYDEVENVMLKSDEVTKIVLWMLRRSPVLRRGDLPIALGVADKVVAKAIQNLRAYNLLAPGKPGNFIRTTRYVRFMRKFGALHGDALHEAGQLYAAKLKASPGFSNERNRFQMEDRFMGGNGVESGEEVTVNFDEGF